MNNYRPLERKLKALANERRLLAIAYLKRCQDAFVGDIADFIGIKIRSMSKHLQILEVNGIIKRRKRGRLVFYRLSLSQEKPIKQIIEHL
ncbi:metalloregulator ArsR/SmtB family transcription factor [Patescibacteria group bacterium]|nr:metalloregulator ArsR/SmtB family transcription factor [Patescibacteria group bacterium]